tara:strand:+ start:1097 stop:1303 length:207 start_codon:yes stop_codon:yes gene_type:complete
MSTSDIQELETKMAFMERHIEEQDKVILRLQKTTDLLVKEMKKLQDNQSNKDGEGNSEFQHDEKPPHY